MDTVKKTIRFCLKNSTDQPCRCIRLCWVGKSGLRPNLERCVDYTLVFVDRTSQPRSQTLGTRLRTSYLIRDFDGRHSYTLLPGNQNGDDDTELSCLVRLLSKRKSNSFVSKQWHKVLWKTSIQKIRKKKLKVINIPAFSLHGLKGSVA